MVANAADSSWGDFPPEHWLRDAAGIAYPPEPWRLGGTVHLSLWWVPLRAMDLEIPPGVRALRFGRNLLIWTAWAAYEGGGVLAYNEVATGVWVRRGAGFYAHVVSIWVDSASSAAGGSALWGIPKERARFEIDNEETFRGRAFLGGESFVSFRFAPRLMLPGWWLLRSGTAQGRDGRLQLARLQVSGRVEFGTTEWEFSSAGPLAFLMGRKPFLSARLARAAISFGV